MGRFGQMSPENAAACGMAADIAGAALVSEIRMIIETGTGRRKRQSRDAARNN
jgi:hypothetical protein